MPEERANVNVKTFDSSKKNNVKRFMAPRNAEKAKYLVEKFTRSGCSDANGCYRFFIKCFSTLSEDTIWSIYEVSTTSPKVHSPIKYFIGACRNQMESVTR